jgi:hypothetical protein
MMVWTWSYDATGVSVTANIRPASQFLEGQPWDIAPLSSVSPRLAL